jgi:hypothetical protein
MLAPTTSSAAIAPASKSAPRVRPIAPAPPNDHSYSGVHAASLSDALAVWQRRVLQHPAPSPTSPLATTMYTYTSPSSASSVSPFVYTDRLWSQSCEPPPPPPPPPISSSSLPPSTVAYDATSPLVPLDWHTTSTLSSSYHREVSNATTNTTTASATSHLRPAPSGERRWSSLHGLLLDYPTTSEEAQQDDVYASSTNYTAYGNHPPNP